MSAPGKLTWEHYLQRGGYATPATHEVDCRQYIAANGGHEPGTKAGVMFYRFALPK